MAKLADVDWIAEAIVERLDIKKSLYKRIDSVRKTGSIVSSNTSTIPISLLVEDMPKSFREEFAITHFFNPVRYMRLLELVRGEVTRIEVIDSLAEFCDRKLGKGVVVCNDTPGFLGNRGGASTPYRKRCTQRSTWVSNPRKPMLFSAGPWASPKPAYSVFMTLSAST